MDSLPGPSKIKDHSPERPRKKYKLEDYAHVRSQSSSSHINDLPDEMLIEIFKYLSVTDRLKAEKVCSRWCRLNNHEVFWRHVKLLNISAQSFIEIVRFLPPCVSYFECHFEKLFHLTLPLSLVELMAKLYDQCPSLEALILENIVFTRHCIAKLSPSCFIGQWLCDPQLDQATTGKQEKNLLKIIEYEFCKEDNELINAVLPEMKILILRHVSFDTSNICIYIFSFGLPNLTVLDLSYSKSSLFFYTKDWLSNLVGLEELYLAGWKVKDCDVAAFIKKVRKLRVLDLGLSSVTDDTLAALHDNSTWLQELYLCGTEIRKVTCEQKTVFPDLRKLCVRKTDVTLQSIEKLLNTCPSLIYVNVSRCKNITENWHCGLCEDFRDKVDIVPSNGDFCQFVRTKHCIFFEQEIF